MSNMYFVTSDSLSDFMEVKYIIWAGDIEDLVLPGTWTIPAGQKKLKSECPHMPDSIKTLWQDPEDSNYVILPDMTGRFCMMETDPTGVGVSHNAQAPNIRGYLNSYGIGTLPNTFEPLWNGSLKVHSLSNGLNQQYISESSINLSVDMDFDASKSNTTYSGTTIRPKAISVLVLVRL